MQKYFGLALGRGTDNSIQPLQGATVTVYDYNSAVLASLFQNDETTPIANPMQTDSNGRYDFNAADGEYDIVIVKSGVTVSLTKILLFSSAGSGSISPGSVGPTQLASTAVTPGTYVLATITVDSDGRVTAASSNAAFTTEDAEDAVGGCLSDSATIDFTYNDAGNAITAIVVLASISNAHLATMATKTIKMNKTGGAAAPTDETYSSVQSELSDWNANVFNNFKANVIDDTSTARTLSATEMGSFLTMSNAGAITLTLHATAPIGYSVTVKQKGAGQITCAPGSGATLVNFDGHTKSAGQYAEITLVVDANSGGSAAVWTLAGRTA